MSTQFLQPHRIRSVEARAACKLTPHLHRVTLVAVELVNLDDYPGMRLTTAWVRPGDDIF
ncbi:TPA: hypothetical protein L6K22_004139 [Salmonella enterica subsp. enterica serovar Typhimurium]|nr:hypothetical protein [Salmonella enterica subsp. enterica serovar Typhimurium]